MSFTKAKELAESAATAAQQKGDTATALLAEAVAEMARMLNRELSSIENKVNSVESKVGRLR